MSETSKKSSLPPLGDDFIMDVAEEVGRQWGMTGSQVVQHMAIGDIPHPSAEGHECGMTDPRDDRKWCRRPPGHDGMHSWFVASNQASRKETT